MDSETYGAHVVSMIPFMWTIIHQHRGSLVLSTFPFCFSLPPFFFTIRYHALTNAVTKGLPFWFALTCESDKWNSARFHLPWKNRQFQNYFFLNSARRAVILSTCVIPVTAAALSFYTFDSLSPLTLSYRLIRRTEWHCPFLTQKRPKCQ